PGAGALEQVGAGADGAHRDDAADGDGDQGQQAGKLAHRGLSGSPSGGGLEQIFVQLTPGAVDALLSSLVSGQGLQHRAGRARRGAGGGLPRGGLCRTGRGGRRRRRRPGGLAAQRHALDEGGQFGFQGPRLDDAVVQQVGFLAGVAQGGDGRLGPGGGAVQLADRLGEADLALAQGPQLGLQPHAVAERRQQQRDQQHVEDHSRLAHFRLLVRLSTASAVIGWSTRTAMCWPRRPMRPVVSGAAPQRMPTSLSAVAFIIRVSPTLRFSTSDRGAWRSSSTARTSSWVVQSSVARWLSQMLSRPNFSPKNCCSSIFRMGSRVAYGSSSSMRPPRSSMSMRSLTRMAALAGRAMAAKRGLVSSRSRLKCTGVIGSKAARASFSTTSTMRWTSTRSMVV